MKEVTRNLDELSDSREVFESKPHPFILIFISILVLLLISVLIWSFIGEIDEVAKASGVVRPNEKVSTIQAPLFGQVESIQFYEGQVVEKGESLFALRLDDLQTELDNRKEDLKDIENELLFLQTFKESVETETNLFDENVEEERVYFHQVEQYFTQQKLLEHEQNMSSSEVEEREKELENSLQRVDINLELAKRNQQQQEKEYLVKKEGIESRIQDIEIELENEKKLKASIEKNKNLIPSSDEKRTIFFQTYQTKLEQLDALSDDQLNNAQQHANETEIETFKNETLLTIHNQIEEYHNHLEQFNQNLVRLNNEGNSSTTEELLLQKESIKQQLDSLQTSQAEQAVYRENTVENAQLDKLLEVAHLIEEKQQEKSLLEEQIQQLNQNLEEGDITAPIRGKVNVIQDVANGDTVQQGERILSILPIEEDSEYKVNIAVPNHEVGKINEGDSINYNFTAFPKQTYGQLTGTVTSISTDSTLQEEGNSYYLVEATLDQTAIEDREGNMKPIRSGMSAEASVVTETKKIIHFVLEKINLKD